MSKLSLLVAIVFFVALFGAYCAPAAEEAAPAEETSAAEPESQAKTAIASSGTIGMYRQTLSPFLAPLFFKTLENLQTSECNSL